MNYIGICDDDNIIADEILKIIKKISEEIGFEVEVDIIKNPCHLLEQNEKKYDAIFLDIDMPNINGIDLAMQLRKDKIDSEIIFVSSEDHMMQKAFKGEPLRFVRKAKLKEEIEEALIALKNKFIDKHILWIINQGNQVYTINRDHIIHIKGDGYYVKIYEENKAAHYLIRISMKEVEEQLSNFGFIRCHKQHIINLNYIKAKEGSELVLMNERRIPISKRNISKVKEAILKNMRRC